jgi:DNA-binding NarL/FixJ family response regulator
VAEVLRAESVEVAEAVDVPAAEQILEKGTCDALIIEARLGNGSTTPLVGRALERAPWLGVIVLTRHATVDDVVGAIRNRAVDYLQKPVRLAALLHALALALHRAERYRVATQMQIFHPATQMLPDPTLKLTQRQRDVVKLLEAGLSSRKVADEMGLSIFTVRNHIKAALKRLGVHSQADLLHLLDRWRGRG